MLVAFKNCIQCFETWAGTQLEPVFAGSAMLLKFFKYVLLKNACFYLFSCYSGSFESTTAWEVKQDCLPIQRIYGSMTRLGNVILMSGGYIGSTA